MARRTSRSSSHEETAQPELRLIPSEPSVESFKGVVGLFAGIGGLELGLHRAGHKTLLLCEIDPGAVAVLKHHPQFRGVGVHEDVTDLLSLPAGTSLITAGFPCQDLSQAGKTAGIGGKQSGLVSHVFRLLGSHDVPWVLLENVPFMLSLGRGRALEYIVGELERLGYDWAYRVIDSRAFGVPQRRERVYLLAAKRGRGDPRSVLFAEDAGEPGKQPRSDAACGFYWTEGTRGLGWAVNAVPTLKGGSTIGIPSPPAIWLPSGEVVKPDIRDTERMQGFDPDWTKPAEEVTRATHRWKLVGNAVTVDVAAWIGEKLVFPKPYDGTRDCVLRAGTRWPRSAWSAGGVRHVASLSAWPVRRPSEPLAQFLRYPVMPLSEKATAGFLSRIEVSSLRFPRGFKSAIRQHLRKIRGRKLSA
jgi:DNA (cytosine-5)-methyltransferase 1